LKLHIFTTNWKRFHQLYQAVFKAS